MTASGAKFASHPSAPADQADGAAGAPIIASFLMDVMLPSYGRQRAPGRSLHKERTARELAHELIEELEVRGFRIVRVQ